MNQSSIATLAQTIPDAIQHGGFSFHIQKPKSIQNNIMIIISELPVHCIRYLILITFSVKYIKSTEHVAFPIKNNSIL